MNKPKLKMNIRQDLSKPYSADSLRTRPEDLMQAETPETGYKGSEIKKKAVNLPEMLSISEAMERTNLSYEYLRYLCYSKKVNHIKCGRKYMIDSGSLAEFIKSGGVEE